MTLEEVWKRIQKEGPAHVLLDKEGTTQMLVLAKKANPELQWDVVYIRNDGWSLGCDFYLAQHAEALHRDAWIGVIMRGAKAPRVVDFRLDKSTLVSA